METLTSKSRFETGKIVVTRGVMDATGDPSQTGLGQTVKMQGLSRLPALAAKATSAKRPFPKPHFRTCSKTLQTASSQKNEWPLLAAREKPLVRDDWF